MELNYEIILEKVKQIIVKAGSILKESFESREQTVLSLKVTNINDFMTEIEKKIETLIIDNLKNLYPSNIVIGKEILNSKNNKKIDLSDTPTWVIDPLDGTTNFIHGFYFVCISISLLINKEPVIGVIYNPILNEMYWAIKNKGSYMNGNKLPLYNPTLLNSENTSLFIVDFKNNLLNEELNTIINNISNKFSIKSHDILFWAQKF